MHKAIPDFFKKFFFSFPIILLVVFNISAQNKNNAFQNTTLTRDERVNDLLSRLTPAEKVGLMMNKSVAIDRLGIPKYDWWNEALHGVARAGIATVFPQAVAMAATFNADDHFNTYTIISDEARAKYHKSISEGKHEIYYGLTFWTPNINIFRDPRWGRGMETYGEDPFLTTRFGVNAVKGLQGNDPEFFKTHACAKHFAVHSGPEWNRHSYNAKASDKDLWETYLPAFEALVKDANVQEVMCAYNRFENAPCCGSGKLLVDILRNKWKYKGMVVSDCWAIDDFYKKGHHETHADTLSASVDAVLNGTDLECGRSYKSLVAGVENKMVDEKMIDIAVRRILKARFDLGMFDSDEKVKWAQIPYSVVDSKKHKAQALKVAQESMTLLKNKNNILPLSKSIKRVAVIGSNANDSVMLWANYNGFPSATTTILKGIEQKLPNAEIIYDKGCDLVDNTVRTNLMNNFSSKGKTGMSAEFFNNTTMSDKPVCKLAGVDQILYSTTGGTQFAANVNLENFSARFEGNFVAPYNGKVYFAIKADDSYKLIINGETVLEALEYKDAVRTRVYALETKKGEISNVKIEYVQGTLSANLQFDVYAQRPVEFETLRKKLENVDVIIYAGGLSAKLEGEEMPVSAKGFRGGDREWIELPEVQQQLLSVLRATGKPVVFVLCTGSAIALQNVDKNYDALLNAWYGGQAGGTAVADVLFGDYNPAGRLPVTFYKSTAQLPGFEDYSMQNRTYRFMTEKPLYPFGFGLSYTSFSYSKPIISSTKIACGGSVKLQVNLKNMGKKDGDEVIQVYVRKLNGQMEPTKSLVAFKRIATKAGKTQSIEFKLGPESFRSFNPAKSEMEMQPGKYEIFVGGSSDNDQLKKCNIEIK
jgi:beta-glucosidase